MPVKMRKRRVKKRKRPGEFSRVKFIAFIAIMVLAVFLGYLTARFVIGPLLGYNADESPIKIAGHDEKSGDDEKAEAESKGDEDKKASSETASEGSSDKAEKPEEGYALQFGVFSTKEAADEMKNDLTEKGIDAEIIEDENMYKVISPVIKTKDEAIGRLNDVKDKDVKDVFIASF